MKKMFNKIADKAAVTMIRAKTALFCKKGESYTGEALKILIAVVLGALLLAGLYLLFNTYVLPTLSQRIRDLFNYTA